MQRAASEMQSVAGVWRFAGAVLLALTSAQPVIAQFPREIAPRTRVRIVVHDPSLRGMESEDGWILGDVARVSVDTLHVRVDSVTPPVAIPQSTMQRLQRSLGTRSLATCTRAGQVTTAVLGASALIVAFTSDGFDTRAAVTFLLVQVGGAISLASRQECWRNVSLR